MSNTITTRMEASDLIGTQWTCPQCHTKEVVNASGIDHKCSNYHVILPLDKEHLLSFFRKIESDDVIVYYMYDPIWDDANFDSEKYQSNVPEVL